jgi:transposase InsO family protein
MGKPLSHTFVYGHNTKEFFASMSSVYRYLKEKDLVKPFCPKRRIGKHVSAHDLLNQGIALLTYDGAAFRTETGITVWAIPVLLLPCRYLLHVGYSVRSVGADDLTTALQEGINFIPPELFGKIASFSDRGSAMTADKFRDFMTNKMGIPVYYGRPHTPNDEPWIEALNKNMQYHREVPKLFPIVDDVISWLPMFKGLYNNDPHSSLKYVTPQEAFDGKMEAILAERKQNLLGARQSRLEAYHASFAVQVVNG